MKNTRGTTCGKTGQSVAIIVCCTWSRRTIYGNKIAMDGPGGSVVVEDHLQCNRPPVSVQRLYGISLWPYSTLQLMY